MHIMKSDENEGYGIANDQEIKYAKQGQPLPQSNAWDRYYGRSAIQNMRSM